MYRHEILSRINLRGSCFNQMFASFLQLQYKEMSGRTRPSEYPKVAEQPAEKKKGFTDFMNLMKPVNEEKDHWVKCSFFL